MKVKGNLRYNDPRSCAFAPAPPASCSCGGPLGPSATLLRSTAYVAKTPPDGYTWLFTTASHTNTPPFNENVPFDPVRDFSHVSLVAQNFGQALIVPAGSPAKSVAWKPSGIFIALTASLGGSGRS